METIICAFITALGVVLSAIISKKSARDEIKKEKAKWNREDQTAQNAAFNAMLETTTAFLHTSTPYNARIAAEKTSLVLSSIAPSLYPDVKALHNALIRNDTMSTKKQLDNIIEKKRNSNSD